MKKIYLLVMTCLTIANLAFAQVGINTDNSAPDPAAMLDVKSTVKGFVLPRMTRLQRNAIPSPIEGLMVYCTNCGTAGALSIFTNGAWLILAPCSTSAPGAGTHSVTTDQVIWNWQAAAGASGYKWNTTADYETAIGMGTALTKTETGMACDSTYTRFVWAYGNCGESAMTTLTATTLPCWYCGISLLTINHSTNAGVAPVNKTTTYGTVTDIPGEPTKCWITSNLGSDHQATAVNDATEASAGWYWQFNRKQGYKHDGSTLTPSWTISSINENSDWQSNNDPCSLELGTQWRIPTYTEWHNVDNTGGWTNWNGPWTSGLKLHTAGYLSYSGGSLSYRGFAGFYWSGTQLSPENGWSLDFDSDYSSMYDDGKANGFSARCVRDY